MSTPAESPAERIVLDALGVARSALPHDARVAVAFSGGIDSSVLLDAAVRVIGPSRCIALHIHHGLSPHADTWLAHCEAVARALGVGFAAQRVDVPRQAGEGVEGAARDVRYRALDAMCVQHGASALWLGHHADDQAETVLLQLLRGAGVAGLAAMAPAYRAGGAAVPRVRPFLHVLRAQLERYAHARRLQWIDDESNDDTRYARNALRHDVMPALAIPFPGYRDALARTAAHAASAQRLLDELARIDLDAARCPDEEGTHDALSLPALLALDEDRAVNLMRYWMRLLELPAASTARLNDAWRQLREIGGGHALRVDHAGQALRTYRGRVYWEAGDSADPADETALTGRAPATLAWRGEQVWHLPQWRGTFVFAETSAEDPDGVPAGLLAFAPLAARARRGGERMCARAPGPSRTLKNLFQERGVPAWRRDVPLLFVGDTLLFVPLLGVNRAVLAPEQRPGPAERHFRIDWREDLQIA